MMILLNIQFSGAAMKLIEDIENTISQRIYAEAAEIAHQRGKLLVSEDDVLEALESVIISLRRGLQSSNPGAYDTKINTEDVAASSPTSPIYPVKQSYEPDEELERVGEPF